ncbi:hypothetical protein BJN34_01335 [Cupriavidus necator]|uniref:Uncharacterized protein n=1 Tax=Cupriavidus necator TaxID=106590 RepID=A0A1U9UIX7_CUPNE|nr:hypothetical protein BJN34_01335 [Cupriavidus necator]
MPIWPARPVSLQPEATLIRWRVFQTERNSRHFAGYCIESGKGRVSSAIVSFDFNTRTGVTRSGRRYVLAGRSEHDEEVEYVWWCWALFNGVKVTEDVSNEYDEPVH